MMTNEDSYPLGIGWKISVKYRRFENERYFSWKIVYDDWYSASKEFYGFKNSCIRNHVVAVEFNVFVDLDSMD